MLPGDNLSFYPLMIFMQILWSGCNVPVIVTFQLNSEYRFTMLYREIMRRGHGNYLLLIRIKYRNSMARYEVIALSMAYPP